jgi:cytochrome c551/c552
MSHFTVGPLYKKIVKKHEEDLDAYNKKVQEESKELTNAIMNVGSTNDDGSVGGAGTGVKGH